MPDFIGVGVVKSATGWTFNQLRKHPQVYTKNKEIHFFDRFQVNLKKYRSYWIKCPKDKVCGEWTPEYFTVPIVPKRIKKFAPTAKLFCILRNPIDRAWSNFKHAKWLNRIPEKTSFRDAFFKDLPGMGYSTLKSRGCYADHLERWFDVFPELNILFFDDLVKDPIKFMSVIYDKLGIDKDFVSPAINKRHKGQYSRYYSDLKLTKKARTIVRDYYLPHIEKLESLLGINLEHWKV